MMIPWHWLVFTG